MREKPAEAKEALRRRMIAVRQGVPLEVRSEWSRAICRHVCESPTFARAAHVVAYVPLGAEVDPHDVVAATLRTGRQLYYPASGGGVEVRRAMSVGDDGSATGHAGDLLMLDAPEVLFLVPGIAFDAGGGRLGRGRGWYDRLLRRFDHASHVGLAFSVQVMGDLPLDGWDVPMDVVVTERGQLPTRRSSPLREGTA